MFKIIITLICFFIFFSLIDINTAIENQSKILISQSKNFTVSELCPDGVSAKKEISADGKYIIELPCSK